MVSPSITVEVEGHGEAIVCSVAIAQGLSAEQREGESQIPGRHHERPFVRLRLVETHQRLGVCSSR
jgi:hypothetical protein